jgi:drug/metabolite transporter (DMT)-like permease
VLPSSGVPSLPQLGPVAYSVIAVFLWGSADFAGGYGSRRANAFVLTAFSHVCAFALMLAIALTQHGVFPSRASIAWALLAGAVGGFSLSLFYGALAAGQMGVTAPIAALVGAVIPTLVDIAIEGTPSRWTICGFALAIIAIWLITRPESSAEQSQKNASPESGSSSNASWDTKRDVNKKDNKDKKANQNVKSQNSGIAVAALAGVGFAGFYLCIHQASGSPIWIATVSRVGSFTATGIAVVVTRAPLALDRPRAALGMIAGFFDISASALFIFASQHGRLDEAVVITSLYPAITVLLARFILKEHFSRWKLIGLLTALVAVPMIAAG